MKLSKQIIAVICLVCVLMTGLSAFSRPASAEGHYTFKTHVSPTIMNEIMGEKKQKAYYSMIDAVLEGKTTFECPDRDTFDWIILQYPYRCFPIVAEYVKAAGNNGYKNGVGHIEYTIPHEEFRAKLDEFEKLVTGILNEALEDDYSDIEKALALYMYFMDHYTYDYDTYDIMKTRYVDDLSGYRMLLRGTGICQELSVAYSYLLLQAGVDATIVMCDSAINGEGHQWSYVTINGKGYHVDPTFALNDYRGMTYFMMTDAKRTSEGAYPKDQFIFSSCYAQFNDVPDCTADDTTFEELWDKKLVSMDTVNNVIYYVDCLGNEGSFSYQD